MLLPYGLEYDWDHCDNSLLVITDCQSLANLFAAKAAVKIHTERQLLVNIGKPLEQLFDMHIHPRKALGSFIEWLPRSYNKQADFLCNYSMDNLHIFHNCPMCNLLPGMLQALLMKM